jgi:hypothetical protein
MLIRSTSLGCVVCMSNAPQTRKALVANVEVCVVCLHAVSIKRQGKIANHALYVCCSLRQFDIRTAFLNRELKEEVFIRAPAGAEHLAGGCGRVLRLRRALHGLRQAPRAWNQRLETELRS